LIQPAGRLPAAGVAVAAEVEVEVEAVLLSEFAQQWRRAVLAKGGHAASQGPRRAGLPSRSAPQAREGW